MDASNPEQHAPKTGDMQQRLSSRLQTLKNDCRQLAADLSSLSAQLTDGHLEHLAAGGEKIAALRQRFLTAKTDILQQVGASVEISQSEFDDIHSLVNLEEILQISSKRLRDDAIAVLDQVLAWTSADARPLESLRTCQQRTAQLREALLATTLPEIHPEVPALADGTHPLALLLRIVTDGDAFSDEQLLALEDDIGTAFGKILFISALRGKILAPPKPAAAIPANRKISITLVDNARSALLETGDIAPAQKETPPEREDRRDDVYAVPPVSAVKSPPAPAPTATLVHPSPPDEPTAEAPKPQGKAISAKSREAFERALQMLKKKLERAWANRFIPEEEYHGILEMCERWERLHPDVAQYREEVQKLGNIHSQLDLREESAIEEKRRALIREILQAKNPA